MHPLVSLSDICSADNSPEETAVLQAVFVPSDILFFASEIRFFPIVRECVFGVAQ